MEKKLPGVFANKIEKEVGNNKSVFYSNGENLVRFDGSIDGDQGDDFRAKARENLVKPKNINQKINDIFKSSQYVYKADVQLTLKDGSVTKRIVGRNSNYLITIDNELIPISDIIDIKRQ